MQNWWWGVVNDLVTLVGFGMILLPHRFIQPKRGGVGASVMRSARLSGGLLAGDEVVVARLRGVLRGSGMYSSAKGDEIVVGGVVVMFIERARMRLRGSDAVVFKDVSRLIAVGCFW